MASKYENNARKPKGTPRPLRLGPPRDDDTHAVWWLWRRRKSGTGTAGRVSCVTSRRCRLRWQSGRPARVSMARCQQPERRTRCRRLDSRANCGGAAANARSSSWVDRRRRRLRVLAPAHVASVESAHVSDEWASPYKRRHSRGCCAAAGT